MVQGQGFGESSWEPSSRSRRSRVDRWRFELEASGQIYREGKTAWPETQGRYVTT